MEVRESLDLLPALSCQFRNATHLFRPFLLFDQKINTPENQ
jgi:hypothetical protein